MIPYRPKIEPYDRHHYVTTERFCDVPAGFVTDGASIPRLFWRVLGHPLDPLTIGPSINHDHAYRTGCIPRDAADARFRAQLLANGVGTAKSSLFYFGVRALGWMFYRRRRASSQTQTKGVNMKKVMVIAALALAAAGCQSSKFEKHVTHPDGTQDDVCVSIWSNMFKRDLDSFNLDRKGEGVFTLALNGYKGDTSEQLPAFTREMWSGLGILGRLAAATVNPAAAGVPLTAEAADADAVAKLVRENAAAKAELAKAKAELKAASAATKTESGCEGDACNYDN